MQEKCGPKQDRKNAFQEMDVKHKLYNRRQQRPASKIRISDSPKVRVRRDLVSGGIQCRNRCCRWTKTDFT
ncbi:hypothetical protein SCLCIDRAFT_307927 [Scleroderma citrinum Foug A]|uniref:Uncharacterized protein n=1 Tax=Scleroderma citrinum Foug A TaxID=1036808 RepID=A0A0C2ZRU2_9AGAM|nr:hypothetical protein SCLCIDRAFT_307927 [Scleroderma citrinum Foug A]